MSRGTQATISASALSHNLERVREHAPESKVWAVVKANAYGHGAEIVSTVLSAADGFAVSTFDEAKALREQGIELPILLLEGVADAEQLKLACELKLDCVFHSWEQLDHLESLTKSHSLNVWLKVDTGMHRLGYSPSDIGKVRERLSTCRQISSCNLMTHLACADDTSNPQISELQLERFLTVRSTEDVTSIGNSASILNNPNWHGDWVRPGIMLYGASPMTDISARQLNLKPVMTFTSPVIAIRKVLQGEGVGYGQRWKAPRDSVIATLAVGYGDGYPRHAPDGTPIYLNGQIVPLVGRVSMDMLMVDVTDVAYVAEGHIAELWGDNLPVDEVANAIGTIGYELLTRISPRVTLVRVD
jgi:alanine racemase